MRIVWLVPALTVVALAAVAAQPPTVIARVAWLQGCWELSNADRIVEEQWMAPRAGSMLGMSRTVRGGKLASYETTVIREQGGGFAFEAHPSGQPQATFLSTSITESQVVFENPAHDFPQQIGYRRNGDSLLAWIAGSLNGKTRRVEFPYMRGVCAPAAAQAAPQTTGGSVARDLVGAIDIHVHSDPDKVPRSLDGLEAARFAKASGMRAIVLKSHYDQTAGLALLARKATPGIEVFGGIDLNLPVGGMNPHAVEHMAQANGGFGRMVWMSTFDSENQARASKSNRPFVRVSQNGALLPETSAVIAAIAKHRLVLASGHVSAQEALLMFEEGRRLGVRGMVATHGMSPPTSLSEEQARQAARIGAFIEFTGGTLVAPNAQAKIDSIASDIRRVGVEHAIISSDLGQSGNPLPADGFATFIDALRKKGFTDQELDRMAKHNPATLLGLSGP